MDAALRALVDVYAAPATTVDRDERLSLDTCRQLLAMSQCVRPAALRLAHAL